MERKRGRIRLRSCLRNRIKCGKDRKREREAGRVIKKEQERKRNTERKLLGETQFFTSCKALDGSCWFLVNIRWGGQRWAEGGPGDGCDRESRSEKSFWNDASDSTQVRKTGFGFLSVGWGVGRRKKIGGRTFSNYFFELWVLIEKGNRQWLWFNW